jgi:serine/threonine protein kinase
LTIPGEVYKAKDTRLDRTVAIKVLPSHLSGDPERRQRFEREARAVSSLNHPNICTLHDIGEQDGTDFLVMEYIEGESLANRLKKGALPLDQALRHGIEIADALDKAHRQGVVHRDLKPGNVMLTKTGAKLLDFGLAKLKASEPGQEASVLSALPTEEKPLTEKGSILGTFQYMAPEQLEGKDADARTDIFAFGAVLYEMVTGKRAFEGKSQASLIGAIMTADPAPITTLKPLTPPVVDRVVRQCRAKDPDERWQSAGDLGRQLRWIAEGGSLGGGLAVRSRKGERIAWTAAVLVLLAALILFATTLPRAPARNNVQKLSIMIPEEIQDVSGSPSVSPDGRHVVFWAWDSSGTYALWTRSLDSLEGRLLPGTDEASRYPFWSPDSQFIGFLSRGQLKKVPLSAGPVQTICDRGTGSDWSFLEGAWNRDGVILYMPKEYDVLYAVPASGGTPRPATSLDRSRGETGHFCPQFLPDGRRFLYLARGTEEEANGIYIGSLDSDRVERVVSSDANAVYAPPGYLLFVRDGNVVAQPFDAEHVRLTGEAVPIVTGVRMYLGPRGAFSVSDSGVLVYDSRESRLPYEIAWLDRSGKRLRAAGEPGSYSDIEMSPDGTRLAVERNEIESGTGDIWQLDLSRDLFSRLTFDAAWDGVPRWSPDGERVAFMYYDDTRGTTGLYQVFSKGAPEPELVLDAGTEEMFISHWSPDGKYMALNNYVDVLILPLFREREPMAFLDSGFNESGGRFSPDGRFFAYVSDETGRDEVYVTTFPEPSSRQRISTEGGGDPKWRSDGEELYYVSAKGHLMAVEVDLGTGFETGVPQELFPVGPPGDSQRSDYAAAADGQRFLVLTRPEGARPQPFHVILNWNAELEQ